MRWNQTPVMVSGTAALLGVFALLAPPAQAHISLEQAGTHVSRDGDANLKEGPCGKAGSTRGTHVYTYAPGETITLSVVETIPHPSYFRIAFDNDGDDDFVDPASIDPIDPNRGCPCTALGVGCTATNDHCTADDFYNNATVLPDMDNLSPHVSSSSGTKYTWQVTLPNVECDNCTLQIIQVMEDPFGHGPYDNISDIYHQCVDVVLKSGTVGGGASSGVAGAGEGTATAGDGTGAAGDGVGAGGSASTVGGGPGGTGTVGGASGVDGNGGAAGALGTQGLTSGGAAGSGSSGGCSVGGPADFTGTLAPVALSLLIPLSARRRRRPVARRRRVLR